MDRHNRHTDAAQNPSQYTSTRRAVIGTLGAVSVGAIAGCSSNGSSGGPADIFENVSVDGGTLTATLATTDGVGAVQLLKPNGDKREGTAIEGQQTVEFNAAGVPAGEYTIVAVGSGDDAPVLDEVTQELTANLQITRVEATNNKNDEQIREWYDGTLISGKALLAWVENTGNIPGKLTSMRVEGSGVRDSRDPPRKSFANSTGSVTVQPDETVVVTSAKPPMNPSPYDVGDGTLPVSGEFTVIISTHDGDLTKSYTVTYTGEGSTINAGTPVEITERNATTDT